MGIKPSREVFTKGQIVWTGLLFPFLYVSGCSCFSPRTETKICQSHYSHFLTIWAKPKHSRIVVETKGFCLVSTTTGAVKVLTGYLVSLGLNQIFTICYWAKSKHSGYWLRSKPVCLNFKLTKPRQSRAGVWDQKLWSPAPALEFVWVLTGYLVA